MARGRRRAEPPVVQGHPVHRRADSGGRPGSRRWGKGSAACRNLSELGVRGAGGRRSPGPANDRGTAACPPVRHATRPRRRDPADDPAVRPLVRALCRDPSVIGTAFYVMDKVPGIVLRGRLPRGRELSPAGARALSEELGRVLAAPHRVDPAAAGLADPGKRAGHVRRQVEDWTCRQARARTWNAPGFRGADRLADRMPDDTALWAVRNDWRLDDLVLDEESPRVTGVLDWEPATPGDPLMDLGSALAHWVQADDGHAARVMPRRPSRLPGMLTRAEVVERYRDRTGLSTDDWPFCEVFGLFRLAVIAQRIHHRYRHRQTRNPAFRNLWAAVHPLDHRCRTTIRRTRGG
ncbi:phosphotransferase family protein [Streptomyces cinereoruber]|uniref:phosphotransferase family protein n=1 Tax=Streptomyces cinereoruber TaxID=67260 RepID=UPI00363C2078